MAPPENWRVNPAVRFAARRMNRFTRAVKPLRDTPSSDQYTPSLYDIPECDVAHRRVVEATLY